jgi:hypothetical protein
VGGVVKIVVSSSALSCLALSLRVLSCKGWLSGAACVFGTAGESGSFRQTNRQDITQTDDLTGLYLPDDV